MWDWAPFSWFCKRPPLSRRADSPRPRVEELEPRTVLSVVPGPSGITAEAAGLAQASLALGSEPAPSAAFVAPFSTVTESVRLPDVPSGALSAGSPLWAFSPVDTLMAQGLNPALPSMSMPLRATSGRLDGGGGAGLPENEGSAVHDAFWEGFGEDPRIPHFSPAAGEQEEEEPGKAPVQRIEHTPEGPAPVRTEEGSPEDGQTESAPVPMAS